MSEPALKEDTKKRKTAEVTIVTGNVPPMTTPTAPSMSPMLQRIMLDPNVSVERVNQAFDFYQRVESDAARKAYFEAKAAFKAVAPAITKDKTNKQYDSSYASIGNVVNTTNESLSKYGLDASWDYDQADRIKVTCILRHVLGHSESVSLTAPPDASGSKNPLQQIKSTLTYLKLATFEAVTGIATREGNADDDGNASGAAKETITEKDAATLSQRVQKTKEPAATMKIILQQLKIESISDIPLAKLAKVSGWLEEKFGV